MDNKFLSIMRWGAIALVAGALSACGGSDSDDGGTTPPPTPTSTFDGTVQEGGGSITAVAVNTPPVPPVKGPVISFKLQDSAGNPVQPTSLVQFRVALAKYVPGTPERWVPFGVKTATTPDPDKFFYSNENRSCGQSGDGWAFANVKYDAATATYTYYFCTDVTTLPDWDAAATYRIGGEVQYNDAPTDKRRTTNPIADFTVSQGVGRPLEDNTGKDVLARKMLDRESCNTCHNDLGQQRKFHFASADPVDLGRRIDPNYCVLCHNDSQFDPATAEPLDMKVMVHKFHMGSRLTGSYAPSGLDATKMHFPQDQRNCTKCHTDAAIDGNAFPTPQGGNWKLNPSRNACGSCHDGIDWATGEGTTLDPSLPWHTAGHIGGAQADDSECAGCHKPEQIAGVNHIPVTTVVSTSANSLGVKSHYASNDGRLPAGAKAVKYEIQSVSLNGNRNPVMVFRILQNGARQDFSATSGISDQRIWPNFVGAPTAYFAYSITQDGVTTPSDFNVYVNQSILGPWNGSVGPTTATLTGPDGSGFYTLTLTGRVIPQGASILTGALGYAAMFQTDVVKYERTCPDTGSCLNVAEALRSNGLNVTAEDVSRVATGFAARRPTTEGEACNNCHQKLGLFAETTFHSGQRNDPKMCAMCHNPNRTSSGWSADSTAFVHAIHASSKREVPYNWHSVTTTVNNVPTLVSSFAEIGFPGNLNRCTNCHEEGGYDFSAGFGQVASRLHRTVATGTPAAAGTEAALSLSPYVINSVAVPPNVQVPCTNSVIDTAASAGAPLTIASCYGLGYGTSTAVAPTPNTSGSNLVSSPIANACYACHDGYMTSSPGTRVKTHIEADIAGGSIYRTREFAVAREEGCLSCHGPTQLWPIKAMHGL